MPSPAPVIAQDLADALFRHFEIALREIGVGDSVVPKKMKTLAEAFLGRSIAYEEALRSGAAEWDAAVKRNIYAGRCDARALAAYGLSMENNLAAASLDAFTTGPVPFPVPSVPPMETIP